MNTLENVVVGLDGCPGGWIACLWREPDDMRFCFVKEPGRLFEFGDSPLVIGIDIPIGLVEGPEIATTWLVSYWGNAAAACSLLLIAAYFKFRSMRKRTGSTANGTAKGFPNKPSICCQKSVKWIHLPACGCRLYSRFILNWHSHKWLAPPWSTRSANPRDLRNAAPCCCNICPEYNCPNGAAWALPNQTIGSMPLQLLGLPEGSMKEKLPKSPTRRCMISMVF